MQKLLLLTCLLWTGVSFSQQATQQSDDFDGTFQILITDSKKQPVFTTDILEQIESMRKDHDDVVFNVRDGVNIYIPSRDKINSPDFEPLELYSY